MKRCIAMRIVAAAGVGLLCFCAKTETKKTAAVIVGTDTLSQAQIKTMLPPGFADGSSAMKQALLRYFFSKSGPGAVRYPDSVAAKLAGRLTMLSGAEWGREAAGVLLSAGGVINSRINTAKDIAAVIAFVDSLSAIMAATADGKSIVCSLSQAERATLEKLDLNDKKIFTEIASVVFGISREEAAMLSSFVREEAREGAESAEAAVKGLLATPVERKVKTATPVVKHAKPPDPRLALKFRPQESIRDSIGRHLPYLQQIYKNQLKLTEMIGGKVMVVFRVDPAGMVEFATIKTSEIDNQKFQQKLGEYVLTIRFKSIPDSAGTMTFEFPFEFKSEK